MKIPKYDEIVCLCVDYRYERESRRIRELIEDDRIKFFIDGKGYELPRQLYNQISPVPPNTWTDGPYSYAHFTAVSSIIRNARDNRSKDVLFIEDDLILTDDFEKRVAEAVGELPDDWDMLYYGANHSEATTTEVSKNLIRVFGSTTTHCVAFRRTIFDAVLSLPHDRTIDWNIAHRLHRLFNCYAIFPAVALQKPGYSQLWKRHVDYTELFNSRGKNFETGISCAPLRGEPTGFSYHH